MAAASPLNPRPDVMGQQWTTSREHKALHAQSMQLHDEMHSTDQNDSQEAGSPQMLSVLLFAVAKQYCKTIRRYTRHKYEKAARALMQPASLLARYFLIFLPSACAHRFAEYRKHCIRVTLTYALAEAYPRPNPIQRILV